MWEELRGWLEEEFPIVKKRYYFNVAFAGPSPRSAVERTVEWWNRMEEVGPGSPEVIRQHLSDYARLKAALVELAGGNPEEHFLALTHNSSDPIFSIVYSVPLRYKRAVITDSEHPSLKFAVHARMEACGGEVVEVKLSDLLFGWDEEELLRRFRKAVGDGCDLLAFSAITSDYGVNLPIKRILEEVGEGAEFTFVDGAQWFMNSPLTLEEIGADAVCFSGYKHFLGPKSFGGLFFKAESAEKLALPRQEAGEEFFALFPELRDPGFVLGFERGMRDYVNLHLALEVARFWSDKTLSIKKKAVETSREWVSSFMKRFGDYPTSPGIVTFEPCEEALERFPLPAVFKRVRGGKWRFSFSIFNFCLLSPE